MNREEYLLKYNKLLQKGVQINYDPYKLTLEELEYNYKILIYRLEREYVEQLKQILQTILPSSQFSEEYIDNILEKYIK